jgi:hypothetical protein
MIREELAELANSKGLIRSAVEIGVADGNFSSWNLDMWKGSKYVLVDPWEGREHQYQYVKGRFDHDPRVNILRMISEMAFTNFKDGELDWVYIDGNHDYDFVLSDLRNWWSKVRIGGIISGHDYQQGFGVIPAVNSFVKSLGLKLNLTDEEWCPSWWMERVN